MLSAEDRIEVIREYARKARLKTFVETGTADGATTLALVRDFARLITIEIDYPRYLHVLTSRFMEHSRILPIWGDSGVVLKEIISWLDGPALFWLDAHYCGGERGEIDTPVASELKAIIHDLPRSVILIDDARLFGSDEAYPSMEWLSEITQRGRSHLEIKDDIIRITPQ